MFVENLKLKDMITKKILRELKQQVKQNNKKGDYSNFLCGITLGLYGHEIMYEFEEYLLNNLPKKRYNNKTKKDLSEYMGVVFNDDKDRLKWLDEQLKPTPKK